MNKKIIYVIGGVLLLLIVYHVIKTHSEHGPVKVPVQPAQTAKPTENQPVIAPVESKDQQMIDSYTAELATGKTENGNVYFQRGLLYLKLQQNRNAIEDFTSALKIVPNSPYLLYNRALAYQQENQLDSAVNDLNAAIKAKPDFVDAYNTRGLVYVDQQDFNDALSDYNQAIKLDPKFTQAYFNLGTMYTRQKKYDEAKKAFTQAISLYAPAKDATHEELAVANRNLLQAYLNRANVELESGDYKSALSDATYVVTNAPQSVEALKMRSAIYDKMGNSAAAADDSAAADNIGMQNMLNEKQ